MNQAIENRLKVASRIARDAGALALERFADISGLVVDQKGTQDLVSDADREVEQFIRNEIARHFVADAIVGEEFDHRSGTSGFTWVIDPIDGTANYVNGIPTWCVVLAIIHEAETRIGTIYDPNSGELFSAVKNSGATLNGKPIQVSQSPGVHDGSLGVGVNNRTVQTSMVRFLETLTAENGVFFRNASGALMLAYVASGRLIGYCETHMNAWDCLAGLLLIEEAGGLIEQRDAGKVIEHGTRVIAGTKSNFETLLKMAAEAGFPEL